MMITASQQPRRRHRPPISRTELTIVVVALLVGAALRLAHPSAMAVEHFDEGVYASNIWFEQEQGYQYPLRHYYAPPLLPALIEWAILLGGTSPCAVMSVNLLAGIATLGLVWWCGREWFGPAAGVAAVALASGSDMHALFSRTALTDVLLVWWLLLALWFTGRALHDIDWRCVVLGGIAAGLAWLTKYNGWLPVAIGFAALLGWLVLDRAARPTAVQRLGAWLAIAIIAVLVWSPYLYSLQPLGGYAAVAEHHRTYVTGISNWLGNFHWQWENVRFLDRGASLIALGVGMFAAALLVPKEASLSSESRLGSDGWYGWVVVTATFLSIACAALLGPAVAFTAWGLFGCAAFIMRLRRSADRSDEPHLLLVLIVAATFVGLLLVTPLYYPYSRLVLPWLSFAWLATGLGVMEFFRRVAAWDVSRKSKEPTRSAVLVAFACPGAALLLALVSFAAASDRLASVAAWQDRGGLEQIGREMIRDVYEQLAEEQHPRENVVVFVYGEPALLFHLRAGGLPLVAPTQDFSYPLLGADPLPAPAFFVTGPHALRGEHFDQQLAAVAENLDLVKLYPYRPSDLVLLDSSPPSRVEREHPTEPLRLYRIR